MMNRSAISYFTKIGIDHSLSEWSLTLIRIPLFLTIISMWAYVWSMAPVQLWNRLGIDWVHLVWYFTLTEIVIFSAGHIHREIENDLREGRFQSYLSRPFPCLIVLMSITIGRLPFNLVMMGAAGIIFGLIATHTFPFSPIQILETVVHMVLASVIWTTLLTMVGLSSLWLGSSGLCYWLVQKSGFICGGLLLPLSLYPDWLQMVSFLTPFPAIFYMTGQVILPNGWERFDYAVLYQIFILMVVQIGLYSTWRRFEYKLLQEG